MEKKPAVTCIITTHNRATLLPRAIDSVLRQTLNDIELIVVDDASEDNTASVVKDKMRNESRLSYVFNAIALGPSGARNRGLKLASGDYVAFLDDDDEWLPNKLDYQVAALKGFSFVCNNNYVRISNDQKLDEFEAFEKSIEQAPCRECALNDVFLDFSDIYPSGTLLNTDQVKRIGGFDESLVRGEFWDLIIKLTKTYGAGLISDAKMVLFDRVDGTQRVSGDMTRVNDVFATFMRHKHDVHPDIARRREVKIRVKRFKEGGIGRVIDLLWVLKNDREFYVVKLYLKRVGTFLRKLQTS